MKNYIECGRCGKKHNVGSKAFKQCQKYTQNKIARSRGEPIQIKGTGYPKCVDCKQKAEITWDGTWLCRKCEEIRLRKIR